MNFLATLLTLIIPLAFGFLVFYGLYALARKFYQKDAPPKNRLVIIIAAGSGLLAALCLYGVGFFWLFANPAGPTESLPPTRTPTPGPQVVVPAPTYTTTPTEEQAEVATEPTETPEPTKTTTPAGLPAFTPSRTPGDTLFPSATPTAASLSVETTEKTTITGEDKLGQLELEYPGRLRPGESASLLLAIYIPPELVSVDPVRIGRINISPDDPPILRELKTYYAPVLVRRVMRVELTSPAFQIEDTYPAVQLVDLDTANNPTYWGWDVVAPGNRGVHVLSLKVYRGEENVPAWVRSIEVEVAEPTPTAAPAPTATFTPTPAPPTATFTPTAVPTATFTPTPVPPTATSTPTATPAPFLQTPAGTALIAAAGAIIAALITGLVSFYVARDSLPFVGTKARYGRRLAVLQNNLARLRERDAKFGPLNVPTDLANEIEETEQQIAAAEARLAELDNKGE